MKCIVNTSTQVFMRRYILHMLLEKVFYVVLAYIKCFVLNLNEYELMLKQKTMCKETTMLG